MGNKVLISGASGFVGQNLVPFLKVKGWSIIPLSRKRNNEIAITYDQINTVDFDNSKAFIHLAGKAHDLKKTSLDEEYYQVNTELTKKLFDLFLKSKCKTFIYFSTVKAVADEVKGTLEEIHPYQPKTVLK